MRTYRFFVLLLIAYCGYAAAAEKSDGIGSKKLPNEAALLCAEHVIGDEIGKSVHIEWQAFGLNEGTDKTARFYQAQFGQPPARDDAGRYTWRFKDEYSELTYSVQPSSSAGPWSRCSSVPPKFKTIVFISNGIWAERR